jgi:hypothetical protein
VADTRIPAANRTGADLGRSGDGIDAGDLPPGLRDVGVGQPTRAEDQLGDFGLRGGQTEIDPGIPTQQTRAPGLERDSVTADTDRTTVSPFAGIGLSGASDAEVRQAVQGSREVARRANQGSVGAQVAEVGRRLQEQGVGISEGVQETLPFEDVGPEVGSGNATVGEQVEGFVGGTAGFPAQIVGGGVQAGGLGTTAPVSQDIAGEVPTSLARAGTAQGQFVQDRPVEAALIGATAVAGSPRARSAARQVGRRAADAGQGLSPQQFGQSLRSNTRAQLQRPSGRSRSSGQSESGSGSDLGPPRGFERVQGRGGGQRSGGFDPNIGGRGPRSGLSERAQFRQRLQEVRNMESGEFSSTLNEPAIVNTRSPTTGPAVSRGVTETVGADLDGGFGRQDVTSEVTGQQPGTVSDVSLDAGGQGQTRGGTSDQVTRDLQQLVAESQAPRARLDDGVTGTSERTFGVDTDGDGLADATVQLDQERASQSEVTTPETSLPADGDQTGVGRPAERGRGRTDSRTAPDVTVGQGQTNRQDLRQPVETDIGTPARPVPPSRRTFGLPETGLGEPNVPGQTNVPNRPRPPGVPGVPGFPGGNSPGGGADFSFSNDEIFATGIESGSSAFDRVFADDSSDDRRRDRDDDDSAFTTGDFQAFFSGNSLF